MIRDSLELRGIGFLGKHCFCIKASVFHLCEGDKMIKEIITQLIAALDRIYMQRKNELFFVLQSEFASNTH